MNFPPKKKHKIQKGKLYVCMYIVDNILIKNVVINIYFVFM